MYHKSLFIFHRDLRIQDNIGLIQAHKQSEKVFPVFIFDPAQCGDKNRFKSERSLQFLIESLYDLDKQIAKQGGKLSIVYGSFHDVVRDIVVKNKIDAVFSNYDYTPFARKRDLQLEVMCRKHKIDCHLYHDALLTVPGEILNGQNKPYQVFSSFYKKVVQRDFVQPIVYRSWKFAGKKLTADMMSRSKIKLLVSTWHKDNMVAGGRVEGLKLLKRAAKLAEYDKQRDFPAEHGTSLLAAHHKFGTISVRETCSLLKKAFGVGSTIISEVVWRDFFTHVAYHFPHVFKGAFKQQYDVISWNKSKKIFQAWCEGRTGFPIVDAGMRQLNQTGFMHNRVRMIVASFLIKDLHINWQWGERYFAQKLIDYDPSVNNGNWQWVAGTGCDAAPYFRVFNPWLQQKKFDGQALYIKKWVPELQKLSASEIHNYFKAQKPVDGYVLPMVDHAAVSKQVKLMYKV